MNSVIPLKVFWFSIVSYCTQTHIDELIIDTTFSEMDSVALLIIAGG